MVLLPYFVHNIKSSRSIAELRDWLNNNAQQKKHPLDTIDSTEELEFSTKGKNSFLITSNYIKWLAIDGALEEHEGTVNIRLVFRQRIFTIAFQSSILLFLLFQIIINDKDRIEVSLFLALIYIVNILHFNWRASRTRKQLDRMLSDST